MISVVIYDTLDRMAVYIIFYAFGEILSLSLPLALNLSCVRA
jgi:hypothetical protein